MVVSPVIELEKLPVPVPFVVLLFETVGLAVRLQHTPRALTVAPPSLVTFPPLDAELVVILVIEVVVKTGALRGIVVTVS